MPRVFKKYQNGVYTWQVVASDVNTQSVCGIHEKITEDGTTISEMWVIRSSPHESAHCQKWTAKKTPEDYTSHRDWNVVIPEEAALRAILEFFYKLRHMDRGIKNNPQVVEIVDSIKKVTEDCFEEYELK
ncbi:MAG: hypothetical protein WA799_00915 [Nitrosotalea sp.]